MPRSSEPECTDSRMIVDAIEDEHLATDSMVINAPGMLIDEVEVDRAHGGAGDTDLGTLHGDGLGTTSVGGTLFGSPGQGERPAGQPVVAQAG